MLNLTLAQESEYANTIVKRNTTILGIWEAWDKWYG
jgi:hypothetical protein